MFLKKFNNLKEDENNQIKIDFMELLSELQIQIKTMFMGSEGAVAYHCDNNYNVKLRHYNIPL